MHRCWCILEVQRAIFHEVDHLPNGKAALASLAQTCRTLNSASLDVLWATLDSFLHLVKCLPRDLWGNDSNGRLVFLRPMSPSDWRVFFIYSNRVRTLSQSGDSERTVFRSRFQWSIGLGLHDNIILVLSNCPTPGPLCPKLKKLDWNSMNETHAPLLRLLLSPSLVTLSLPCSLLHSPEIAVLSSIGTICSSLKSLRLSFPKTLTNTLGSAGERILSEALLKLHSLKTLSFPAIDEAALIHLSNIPLVNLTLGLPLSFRVERVKHHMVAPAFASLDSLTLHVHSLSVLASLLQSLRFKPTFLSFVVADNPTADALRSFFATLVNACDSEELVCLSFTASGDRQRGVQPEPIMLSTFQPLFAFSDLHTFELDMQCDMALDDDAIAAIAKQWRNIATLSLNAHSGWGIPSSVTHRGLITLLGRCPALAELALAIDFSAVDLECPSALGTTRPGGGVSNARCRIVNVVSSVIDHPVSIASFLSDVCPHLLTIDSSWYSDVLWTNVAPEMQREYADKWAQVNALFPAFAVARMQAMNWALETAECMQDTSPGVGARR